MDNVAKWHHGVPNDDEFSRAMANWRKRKPH